MDGVDASEKTKTPGLAGVSEVGGTGLEPVTPSLSNATGESLPFVI